MYFWRPSQIRSILPWQLAIFLLVNPSNASKLLPISVWLVCTFRFNQVHENYTDLASNLMQWCNNQVLYWVHWMKNSKEHIQAKTGWDWMRRLKRKCGVQTTLCPFYKAKPPLKSMHISVCSLYPKFMFIHGLQGAPHLKLVFIHLLLCIITPFHFYTSSKVIRISLSIPMLTT